MPTNTAIETLKAYKLKRQQNPYAGDTTIFKYILWDRFKDRMIQDSELDAMAENAGSLSELAYAILAVEKPQMAEGKLAQEAKEAIRKFFENNHPAGL